MLFFFFLLLLFNIAKFLMIYNYLTKIKSDVLMFEKNQTDAFYFSYKTKKSTPIFRESISLKRNDFFSLSLFFYGYF